jgi:hypothetical protein
MPAVNDDATQNKMTAGTARTCAINILRKWEIFFKKAEKHKMDENDFWNVKIAIKWLQNGIQFSLFVDILYLQQAHGVKGTRYCCSVLQH